jgi:hypothetical protein
MNYQNDMKRFRVKWKGFSHAFSKKESFFFLEADSETNAISKARPVIMDELGEGAEIQSIDVNEVDKTGNVIGSIVGVSFFTSKNRKKRR